MQALPGRGLNFGWADSRRPSANSTPRSWGNKFSLKGDRGEGCGVWCGVVSDIQCGSSSPGSFSPLLDKKLLTEDTGRNGSEATFTSHNGPNKQ